MPEPTPAADQPTATPTEVQLRADLRAKALVEERAGLEKLTKTELVERVQQARTESEEVREALREARDRHRVRPEDAMVVSALIDLHRTAEERQGPTIRGRSPAIGNRYLEAAKALGDGLVDAILGPAKV